MIVVYHKGEREYAEQLQLTYSIHGMVEYSPSTLALEALLMDEVEDDDK